MKLSIWVGVFLLAGVSSHLAAQAPTLEQLQKQVDAAKDVEAAKRAATQKNADAARRADAERQRQAAATKAASARMATLLVQADAPCSLTVNGEDKGLVEPDNIVTVKAMPGDQIIECTSTEIDSVKIREVKTLRDGMQSAALLDVASMVAESKKAQEAVAANRLKAQESVAPESLKAERFEKVADGVRDHAQNVVWASSDNGSDVNWSQAGQYCQSLGSGWHLPTTAQLLSLYDPNSQYGQKVKFMMMLRVTIKPVTPLIRLNGIGYWSSEVNGSSEAFSVNLYSGYRGPYAVSVTSGARALCVLGS